MNWPGENIYNLGLVHMGSRVPCPKSQVPSPTHVKLVPTWSQSLDFQALRNYQNIVNYYQFWILIVLWKNVL